VAGCCECGDEPFGFLRHGVNPHLKENTILHHYKNQLVNAVQGNNRCLHRDSYKTQIQNAQLLIGEVGGTYSCHSALKG
jgi:hypothetical protein